MNKQEILDMLKEELELRVVTQSEYTGGMDGSGNLYKNHHTVQLWIAGELISEESLS